MFKLSFQTILRIKMKPKKKETTFGGLLKEARLKMELTQQQLGDMVGVDDSYINRLEKGTRPPTGRILDNIANALQILPEQLFARNDKKEIETRHAAFLRDIEELKKYKLDLEQLTAGHWVIKRLLLEVTMDKVRNPGKGFV